MRIGHGFDVHKFGPGNQITLAGVSIPYEQGLVAHSDGDVLLHALTDALLGAAALGDIGAWFPDTDASYRGADSRQLLRQVLQEGILPAGYTISNVDITVVAQVPKLRPHIDTMRQRLADDLNLAVSRVSIKATTTEGLGFTGRREGIAVHAVVLLNE